LLFVTDELLNYHFGAGKETLIIFVAMLLLLILGNIYFTNMRTFCDWGTRKQVLFSLTAQGKQLVLNHSD
jgi:hypothetical protein